MYTLIKLKNELLNRQLLILITFSVIFVTLLNIFDKSMEAPTNFKVNIADEDNTLLSQRAVKAISKLSGVEITENDADISYVINKGFGEHFKKGKLSGLIEVKKNSFKQGASLLNDRIAIRMVSDYIYLNLYDRINAETKLSFEEYEKSLERTKLENEILSVMINDRKINDRVSSDINFSSYIMLLFMLLVSLNMGIYHTVRLNRMRTDGILDRLKISGLSEINVILDEVLIVSIKSMAVIVPFILLKSDINVYIIAISLFYLNLILNLILERISKSEEALVFAARSVMILFLGVGVVLKFYI